MGIKEKIQPNSHTWLIMNNLLRMVSTFFVNMHEKLVHKLCFIYLFKTG